MNAALDSARAEATAPPAAAAIGRLVDDVAGRYASRDRQAEIRAARERFDGLRGQVFDDDEIYSAHMALFLEWYVIERPLEGLHEPPLRVALRAGELDQVDLPLAWALARSHRSAFEVAASRDLGLRLYDLIGDSFWWIPLADRAVSIVRGEIFEARLLPWRGAVCLGPNVFYQPRAAHAAIHALVKARSATGSLDRSLVDELAEMRLRHSRFRNIAIEHIYREPRRRAEVETAASPLVRPGR